ncbi:major facilitator superfamily domain-containing protein [Schizophyllum commune]
MTEATPTASLTRVNSVASSTATHIPPPPHHAVPRLGLTQVVSNGHGESAIPEDKALEAVENLDDNWQDDPANPRNWAPGRKWLAAIIVSWYTFVSPLTSSAISSGLPELAMRYGITNPTVEALCMSIYLLSMAIGPLFIGPISEMYGRTYVYHITAVISLALNLACAYAPTAGSLIALRFLSGFAGSAPVAIGPGSIGDIFSERERSSAMAAYSLGPLMGPIIGPICCGFITEQVGVKYVFTFIACLNGSTLVLGVPFLRETFAPVVRVRRAKATGEIERWTEAHPLFAHAYMDKGRVLWASLSRPTVLLTRSAICGLLCLYMAFMYGIYFLMFATFADFFHSTYGFSTGIGGLAYIGLGVGFLISALFGAKFGDAAYHHLSKKHNNGKGKPEYRVPVLIVGSFFVPIGIFWYGWSAQARIHWIMPIIGSGIFGFGILPIQLYLVDTFTYAASAVSAATFLRSMLGFAFPLFGKQMFKAMGMGGANSLLGGSSRLHHFIYRAD